MNITVTGAAGFIGSHVAEWLHAAGHRVTGIDDLSLGKADNLRPDIPLIISDAASREAWEQIGDIDAIVHLGGPSSTPMFLEDPPGAYVSSLAPFLRVLEEARARRVAKVVYASSSLIYGNAPLPLVEPGPTDVLNSYALSKLQMEQIARMYETEFSVASLGLRFMSIYGPRENHKGQLANLVSQFIWSIEAGRAPLVYGDGSQTRDFTSVWDAAQAIRRAIERDLPAGTRILNVGTGVETSVNALVALLSRTMGVPVRPEYTPVPGGRPYNLRQRASLDLIAATGYAPSVTLEEGIEEILRIRGWRRR